MISEYILSHGIRKTILGANREVVAIQKAVCIIRLPFIELELIYSKKHKTLFAVRGNFYKLDNPPNSSTSIGENTGFYNDKQ